MKKIEICIACAIVCLLSLSMSWAGPLDCPDADGDQFTDAACGGEDCDDTDPNINPCAFLADTLPADGVDQDCTRFDWGEVAITPEVEPNDEYGQDLVVLGGVGQVGQVQVEGDIDWYDPLGQGSDLDLYVITLGDEGFLLVSLGFECMNDLDLFVAYMEDDNLYLLSGPSGGVPEFFEGFFFRMGGWEFPQELWMLVNQTAGGIYGDPYHLELYFENACVDGDGDGYSAARRDTTEWVDWGDSDALCGCDCDDSTELVNPGQPEGCGPDGHGNGIDDNCNGEIDEACCGYPECCFIGVFR